MNKIALNIGIFYVIYGKSEFCHNIYFNANFLHSLVFIDRAWNHTCCISMQKLASRTDFLCRKTVIGIFISALYLWDLQVFALNVRWYELLYGIHSNLCLIILPRFSKIFVLSFYHKCYNRCEVLSFILIIIILRHLGMMNYMSFIIRLIYSVVIKNCWPIDLYGSVRSIDWDDISDIIIQFHELEIHWTATKRSFMLRL